MAYLTSNQVLALVEAAARGGFQGKISPDPPRGCVLLDRETKMRDPFAVYSKYGQENDQQQATDGETD